jgi:hypothetical protein
MSARCRLVLQLRKNRCIAANGRDGPSSTFCTAEKQRAFRRLRRVTLWQLVAESGHHPPHQSRHFALQKNSEPFRCRTVKYVNLRVAAHSFVASRQWLSFILLPGIERLFFLRARVRHPGQRPRVCRNAPRGFNRGSRMPAISIKVSALPAYSRCYARLRTTHASSR